VRWPAVSTSVTAGSAAAVFAAGAAHDVTNGYIVSRAVSGPEIVLCADGQAVLAPADGTPDLVLAKGRAAFVPASTGRYDVRAGSGGHASLYRATVNLT